MSLQLGIMVSIRHHLRWRKSVAWWLFASSFSVAFAMHFWCWTMVSPGLVLGAWLQGTHWNWKHWFQNKSTLHNWLVVWNILYFPYIGKNHPNWRSYFSEGFKPPTSHESSLFSHPAALKKCATVSQHFWDHCRSRELERPLCSLQRVPFNLKMAQWKKMDLF